MDFQNAVVVAIWYIKSEHFPIFDLQLALYFLQIFESLRPSRKERFQIDSQSSGHSEGGRGSHLEFLIGTILAIFDFQVALILFTKV